MMAGLRRTLARLLGFLGLGPSEKGLEEELRFHLAELARQHERAGLDPVQAARRARQDLILETTREEWRDERSFPAMEQTVQDLRHAARGLRRDAAFSCAAVMTLALGLAASTVVHSLIQGVLLRPLPYPEAERLVRVFETSAEFPRFPVSPLNFLDYAQRARAFAGFGAWTRVDLELSSAATPLRLRALQVSPGYFTVLGARPALGRAFEEREQFGDPRVVILSHRLWQDRFGGDPGVLGRVLRLDRNDFTVVGVMPAGFEHAGGDYRSLPQGEHVDAWWPIVLDAEKVHRGWHYLNVVARLAPATTLAQGEADLNRVMAELQRLYPQQTAGYRVTLQPLREAASDALGAPGVVVVNEAFARKYFPGEDAIGRRLAIWGKERTIVGVVGDVKDAPADLEAKPAFAWPLAQQPFRSTTVVVRADAPAGLYEGVRSAIAAVDRELPIANLRPLAEVARDAHARRRFSSRRV